MSSNETSATLPLEYATLGVTSRLPLLLAVMMFLEYAARGIWYPYLANYLMAIPARGGLGFTGAQVGWIMGLATAIGAITSPLVAGQLADRYLNGEKALGVLILISGVLLLAIAKVRTYPTFLMLFLLQSLAYMPTLALTNGLCFTHLRDPEKSFPPIRMWGTIAWMVSSTVFPLLFMSGKDQIGNIANIAWSLTLGGATCILLFGFCYMALPATPPKHSEKHPLAFVEAFSLLRLPAFLLLILLTLPVSIIHTAYYIRVGPFFQQVLGGVQHVGPALALGQISEIISLLFLGGLLKRLGYRTVFTIALAAFALRFGLFALGNPPWLVVLGGSLHGICFAFFFAAAYVFVEKIAPADARHSAQTVFNLIALGVGPILAGFYNSIFDQFTTTTVAGQTPNYMIFWSTQTAIAAFCALLLMFFPRKFTSRS